VLFRACLFACLSAALQGLVVFNIDGEQWALDLRQGSGSVSKGAPAEKPDLTLTISDENFVKLVMGKLNPQQVRIAL
jgi:putative sterol carrier protein